MIDRSGEGRVRVTGADRVTWLQGLLTNDIAALTPGTGCYAAWLTPQGRMITDVRVLDVPAPPAGDAEAPAGRPLTGKSAGGASDADDVLLLDLPGAKTADVLQRFDMFIITEDVTVEDVTPSLARLGLHGQGLWQTLSACVELPADAPIGHSSPLPEHANVLGTFRGRPVIVAGCRELGVPGVDLYVPTEAAADLHAALLAAGAEEMDDEAWQTRRIEAGRPRFGADMTEDTIPLEAGIEGRAISFSKGCYVGQEIIIRVTHRGGGRVARRLVGLAPASSPAAAAAVASRGGDAPQGAEERGPAAMETAETPEARSASTRSAAHASVSGSASAAASGLAVAPSAIMAPSAGDVPAQPAAGAQMFVGDRPIGQLTSVAFSPRFGHWIALGYVHRDYVAPGTAVRIALPPSESGGDAATDASVAAERTLVDAAVAPLPFVPPALTT